MTSTLTHLHATPDLVDQVYQRLLDAISDGSLQPGTRLTQELVAERLAVSRQPVLQALRLLKADGLVQEAPSQTGLSRQKGRGVVVAPLNTTLIRHIYDIRAALDMLAARHAARQRATTPLACIAQGRAAQQSGDIHALIQADLAFHQAIYAASGNPLIQDSAMLHWCHIRRAMGEALRTSRLRASVWDEHEAIARAIADGDAQRASDLLEHHCLQASAHLVAQLQDPPAPRNSGAP
jgi:DNA-binding GntR family transcriptional regulator